MLREWQLRVYHAVLSRNILFSLNNNLFFKIDCTVYTILLIDIFIWCTSSINFMCAITSLHVHRSFSLFTSRNAFYTCRSAMAYIHTYCAVKIMIITSELLAPPPDWEADALQAGTNHLPAQQNFNRQTIEMNKIKKKKMQCSKFCIHSLYAVMRESCAVEHEELSEMWMAGLLKEVIRPSFWTMAWNPRSEHEHSETWWRLLNLVLDGTSLQLIQSYCEQDLSRWQANF